MYMHVRCLCHAHKYSLTHSHQPRSLLPHWSSSLLWPRLLTTAPWVLYMPRHTFKLIHSNQIDIKYAYKVDPEVHGYESSPELSLSHLRRDMNMTMDITIKMECKRRLLTIMMLYWCLYCYSLIARIFLLHDWQCIIFGHHITIT